MGSRQRNNFRQGSAQKYQPYMQNRPAQSASPLGWFSDLSSTGSDSYGSYSGSGGSGSCFSIDICPDLILAAIAAAAAAAAFLIYQAITVAGKRKKRDDESSEDSFLSTIFSRIISENLRMEDFIHLGSYISVLHAQFLHLVNYYIYNYYWNSCHMKDFSVKV